MSIGTLWEHLRHQRSSIESQSKMFNIRGLQFRMISCIFGNKHFNSNTINISPTYLSFYYLRIFALYLGVIT